MNILLLEKEDNLDDIEYYLSEYYNCIEAFEIKKSENEIDNKAFLTDKLKKQLNLIKEQIKKEKRIEDILEDIKDIRDSKLFFYLGSYFLPIPSNTSTDKNEIDDLDSSNLIDYYYEYDKEVIVEVVGLLIDGKRIEIQNEIDVSNFFKLTPDFFGKLNKKDKNMIVKTIRTYVDGKIQENDFQEWEDLRASINQDLAEKKDILKVKRNVPTKKGESLEQ